MKTPIYLQKIHWFMLLLGSMMLCQSARVLASDKANTKKIVVIATDDYLPAVAFGETVTVLSSILLSNDVGTGLQLQSVCPESVNGGTIVNNGNGTYTYYPPAGVNFLATDSFCYTIIDTNSDTATANVVLTFTGEEIQDPMFDSDIICHFCNENEYILSIGHYNLIIAVVGTCPQGYSWINNLNTAESGEIVMDESLGVGYLSLEFMYQYFVGEYSISIIDNCTQETYLIEDEYVQCAILEGPGINHLTQYATYGEPININAETLYQSNFGDFYPSDIDFIYCETSENGGTFTENGDGTFTYIPPVGVASLSNDIVCLTMDYGGGSGYQTYLELVFTNVQDPQFDINMQCCGYLEEDEVYVGFDVKGVCEEGYTWINNNNPTESGQVFVMYENYDDVGFIVNKTEGYNLTFTNNCTGEIVTISGEADCPNIIPIAATDDPQTATEYGTPVTIVGETLLLNDTGDGIQLQSVCPESENGGTIVNNGDGTYTYYPPAGVNFLATDSFCYTIIDTNSDTATAEVVLTFTGEEIQDPILAASTECINCDDFLFRLFNLTITVLGNCEQGYTWVNNLNPNQGGDVTYDALSGVGVIYLTNLPSDNGNGYDITVINECTGETATVASMVDCVYDLFFWPGFIPLGVNYSTQIVITQDMINEFTYNFFGFSYNYENVEFCNVSENSGTFADNGDGTYLYTAPVGVDSLLSDIICVSIYNEQNNYTEETYLELIFADIQDPQFETNLLCCSSGDIFAHFLIKGVCEEGYTWVNNNDTTQGGMIYCYIVCLENLIFQIDETTGYNYTFTNNCTGESVTISGEADCGYNTINIPIEALDDPQPPVAYGNPITITIAYLAYNDYGDGPVVQSLCSESANGGTIIDNGDGTATYYPPTEVSYLPTDSFCYEMTDATGQTDMANVIFNFTENQSIDPILEATQECGWEESGNNITPSGLYNLYITVLGDCDEGYTWVNNYTPSQGGEVFYNALIDVGVIVYYGASSPFSNGYSFSVINNCTGEIAVLEDVDACRKICTPYSIDDIAYSAKYEEAIILSEEILRNSALPGKLWEKYSRMELCEVSENGGKIIQSEHGTYIYNPPSGETLVSDKICATLYNEHNESEETYIDLKFLDQQDPQLSISTDCSHSAETYDVIIGLLGECEEGYTWTNNKGANTGGQCKIARNTPLKLTFLKENDYNLTFTNNCTGESVTISGEAECAIYTTIDAIDDRQDAVEYGNPITIVGETLLLNDFGDSISLQSVCIESENGGTVINNGDGTYTYNPPADTAFLATDNFCYTIVDANGDTATANVIFYFYNNPQDDPTLMLTTHCQVYDEGVSNGYFDLLITIFGKCMEGYTWVSNDPTQAYSGEIQLDSLTKVAYLQLVLPSDNERGYDITITSKCTGISQNLSQWVYCSSFICSLPICNIFDGRVLAQGNELTWRYFIVNEDIAYFTLARAIDGVTFEPIGKIMPDLTNSTEYVFLDQDAPEGVSYYRLSWTDTSGVEDKYNIIPTLTRDKASTDAICVYPNPTKETLYLDYASKTTAESSLKIYDIWGRVVLEKSLATYAGFNQEQLNIADFAPGTYFLVLIDGDKKTSTKFIKK